MLVQLALIVFAMCAMLSLIIDVGFARVTQGQMQNAADVAAIEGIHQRSVVSTPGNPVTEADRRAAVSTIAGWVFDEDYDPTDADVNYQFGAGPIIDLTDGATSLHGLQTASVPDVHVYKPVLQANVDNAPEGDMVSGQFCYNADPARSEDAAYELQDTVCGQPQRGSGAYTRNDFNPGTPGGNAFLVRLRRSNEYQDLEGQTDPDVASSGPSIPLTFGKATTIHGDDPTANYSVRRDGLTVRATGIAEARAVVRLGAPRPGARAMAQFVLSDACAQSPNGAAVTIPVSIPQTGPQAGLMLRTNAVGASPTCGPNAVVGRFIVQPPPAPVPPLVRTIGALLPNPVTRTCQSVTNVAAVYSPIYSQMANGQMRLIGYATASLTRQANCPGAGRGGALPPFTATIVRAASAVAPSNASAVFETFPTVPAVSMNELIAKNRVRTGTANYGPVLAPVLAR